VSVSEGGCVLDAAQRCKPFSGPRTQFCDPDRDLVWPLCFRMWTLAGDVAILVA
jgi:hypothetical protein